MAFPDAPQSPIDALVRRLYAIAADYERGFAAQAESVLALGCEHLHVDIGILAQIAGNEYEVMAAVSPTASLHAGQTFALGDTYCALTMESDGPVGFENAGTTHLESHPAYQAFRLEAYLGVPLWVRGVRYGTLNFSSPTPRQRKWTAADVDAMQLMAHWFGGELARRETETALRAALREVRTLSGLLPICAHCKSVRDDAGLWRAVEAYLARHTEARFSHGICPDCAEKVYPSTPPAPADVVD